MWFWVKDEWSKSFLEKDNFINWIVGNAKGTGWPDKLCHLLLHLLIVLVLTLILKVSILLSAGISIIFGVLYEWIVDCLIFKEGASKFDLIANTIGMLIAVIILKLGGLQ